MAFTDSNFRQECPNCGYNDGNNFRIEELCWLRPPYVTDPGNLTTCEVAERKRYPVCRKCGFVIGLEAEDDLQREAVESAREFFDALETEPSFEMESEMEPDIETAESEIPTEKVPTASKRQGAK